jgi:hypothetical protein
MTRFQTIWTALLLTAILSNTSLMAQQGPVWWLLLSNVFMLVNIISILDSRGKDR